MLIDGGKFKCYPGAGTKGKSDMKYKLVKREARVKVRNTRDCGRWYFERTGHFYWEIHWLKKGIWEAWKCFDNRRLALREIARLREEAIDGRHAFSSYGDPNLTERAKQHFEQGGTPNE